MKTTLLLALAGTAAAAPVLLKASQNEVIDGEYIIKLKSNVDKSAASTMAKNFYARNTFRIGRSFAGFSARLSPEELAVILADPSVDMVSPNVKVYATGIVNGKQFEGLRMPNATFHKKSAASCPDTQQAGSYSWGQARITSDTPEGLLTGGYQHDAAWGAGVDLYVIDTGTLCSHEEFAGRSCECGPDYSAFIPGRAEDGCADGNGHGTFCSSIAAGNVYGVAKNANLIGVKALGNAGSGTLNGIVDSFNWVAEQAAARGNPAVASVSLGTQGTNDLVDAAANALAEVAQTAIAAGNSGSDPRFGETCTGSSPAAAELPVTVGSSTDQDERSEFSNYGKCNDVYAPGSDITGAYAPGDSAYITGSGTSMATPHVAGVMASMLSLDTSMSPEALKAQVLSESLVDLVDHACSGTQDNDDCRATPNNLAHISC